jgi:hypothetical protein
LRSAAQVILGLAEGDAILDTLVAKLVTIFKERVERDLLQSTVRARDNPERTKLSPGETS